MSNPKSRRRFPVGKYYEVSDLVLGRGSFSTVYLARHKAFGNKIALKIIDRNDIKEEYVLKNLYREARILKRLSHPNIVNFYEDFTHNHLYCISMEFINGTDLTQYLKKQAGRMLSEHVAKILFYQIISAVHHMHESHILHRDLKQENILLEYDKVIKIVDFGLSNVYQPNVKLRTHCGSLVYAAPELFDHHSRYGSGVDMWSLGVILYSMVVGRMPFQIPKKASQINKDHFYRRISEGLTEENWEKMGALSYDCCNLLERLLQPDPSRRMDIKETRRHHWLHGDGDLRTRLPNIHTDLAHKKTEIVEFMSEKLSKPVDRVTDHLTTNKFDKVSALFYMLYDTLLKEVLYPPKDLEKSFMYQLECRKKEASFRRRHSSQYEEKLLKNDDHPPEDGDRMFPYDSNSEEFSCAETTSTIVNASRRFSADPENMRFTEFRKATNSSERRFNEEILEKGSRKCLPDQGLTGDNSECARDFRKGRHSHGAFKVQTSENVRVLPSRKEEIHPKQRFSEKPSGRVTVMESRKEKNVSENVAEIRKRIGDGGQEENDLGKVEDTPAESFQKSQTGTPVRSCETDAESTSRPFRSYRNSRPGRQLSIAKMTSQNAALDNEGDFLDDRSCTKGSKPDWNDSINLNRRREDKGMYQKLSKFHISSDSRGKQTRNVSDEDVVKYQRKAATSTEGKFRAGRATSDLTSNCVARHHPGERVTRRPTTCDFLSHGEGLDVDPRVSDRTSHSSRQPQPFKQRPMIIRRTENYPWKGGRTSAAFGQGALVTSPKDCGDKKSCTKELYSRASTQS